MTLNDFTTYCTEEQTQKGLALGAPIQVTKRLEHLVNRKYISDLENYTATIVPTAEQMIGWLETQGIKISVYPFYLPAEDGDYWYCSEFETPEVYPCGDFKTRPEATLAVITKALEYLEQHQS